MEWYLKVVRDNYANFNGRARRKEYWMFVLVNVIISVILGLIDGIFGLSIGGNAGAGVLGSIYALAVFVPGLAVAVRRLHDTGRSGWNYLWVLTCIGIIYVLYLMIIEGDQGQNEYGADPKGGENEDPFAGQRGDSNPFVNPNNPFNNDNN
ncbi:MAG TPA: DUF805 domain-containing protein [Sphingobacterium sp.]|nr:DUF805 domain-containing protein [Sphingobacterium sp.]